MLTLLEQNNVKFPEEVRAAAELTDYSVEARYPGPFEAVSEEEFLRAVKIAETVISWAEISNLKITLNSYFSFLRKTGKSSRESRPYLTRHLTTSPMYILW